MTSSGTRPKSRLIIPDADVIIRLCELGVWDKFIAVNSVFVAQTVVDEAHFHTDADGRILPINLTHLAEQGKIQLVDVGMTDLIGVHEEAKKMRAPLIHDGERDTLAAVLSEQTPELTACLIDEEAITCAVLIGLKESCISVESALRNCGLPQGHLHRSMADTRFDKIVGKAEIERTLRLLS